MPQWPQGAPDAETTLQSGDKIGLYKPTESGTKNVKVDADDLKAFAQGTLPTDVQNNADNITSLTIGVNTNASQIATNKTNIESNDDDITALQVAVASNDSDINNLQAKTTQSYNPSDTPQFKSIVNTEGGIYHGTGTGSDIFAFLSPIIPSVGNKALVHGSIVPDAATYQAFIPISAERVTSTRIDVKYMKIDTNFTNALGSLTIDSASTLSYSIAISIGIKF